MKFIFKSFILYDVLKHCKKIHENEYLIFIKKGILENLLIMVPIPGNVKMKTGKFGLGAQIWPRPQ